MSLAGTPCNFFFDTCMFKKKYDDDDDVIIFLLKNAQEMHDEMDFWLK